MLEINHILLQINIKKIHVFYDEDAYYYYDIDVDRISLFKKRDNKYLLGIMM